MMIKKAPAANPSLFRSLDEDLSDGPRVNAKIFLAS